MSFIGYRLAHILLSPETINARIPCLPGVLPNLFSCQLEGTIQAFEPHIDRDLYVRLQGKRDQQTSVPKRSGETYVVRIALNRRSCTGHCLHANVPYGERFDCVDKRIRLGLASPLERVASPRPGYTSRVMMSWFFLVLQTYGYSNSTSDKSRTHSATVPWKFWKTRPSITVLDPVLDPDPSGH